MAERNLIMELLQDPSVKSVILCLLQFVLEQHVDDDFVCPCTKKQNIVTFLIFTVFPGAVVFLITWKFMDFFQPADENITKKAKKFWPLATSLVWVSLCLIDGRYVACVSSAVEGEYVETEALKWCKSDGNATDSVEKAQYWMSISQDGGLLMMMLVFLYALLFKHQTFKKKVDTNEMAAL